MRDMIPPFEGAKTRAFRRLRDHLLNTTVEPIFDWPDFNTFNWAYDWFDAIAQGNDRVALRVVSKQGDTSATFDELSQRSDQVAGWLKSLGINRKDRILLLLPNSIALYEIMLASIKLGAVFIPCHMNINHMDYLDRIKRGNVKHIIAHHSIVSSLCDVPDLCQKITVDGVSEGWIDYEDSFHAKGSWGKVETKTGDELLGYFTSGTTSKPKLVMHSQTSYPVGHLSSMYWNGTRPGDVHLNVSSPGWAKHSWSSFFVPWNAEATIVTMAEHDAGPEMFLDVIHRCNVTTFCGPPTIWRKMIAHGLGPRPDHLRELVGAGEPLTPEVCSHVMQEWGLLIRDGYGQTEATAMIGTGPGCTPKENSIGKALPGYRIVLIDQQTGLQGNVGEICVDLNHNPVGLMIGYDEDKDKNKEAFLDGYYHTGDIATRDADGYFTVLGRSDDVFKSFDYRISPYELENILIKHDLIECVAVVPSPDPVGQFVPKAYVLLKNVQNQNQDTVNEINRWQRDYIKKEQSIRRLAFIEQLPRTVTGKIRRADLRCREENRLNDPSLRAEEFELTG